VHKADRWINPEKLIGEHQMPLVTVVITLGVIGLLLWLVNRFIPMQWQIKSILNGVVVIAVVLWLMKLFGLFEYLSQFRIGH
jgi:putative exporter of polyketide antibiotics